MSTVRLDIAKIEAEIAQSIANTAKLSAETMKLQREARWYPWIAVAAFAAAVAAVGKLFYGMP